jgi:hypothetical protein
MTGNAVVAAIAAVAVSAGLAAPAHAVRRGTFTGTLKAAATGETASMGFKVDRRGRVTAFRFADVKLSCSDGDTVTSPKVVTPRGVTFPVRSNRFGIEARNDETGFGWDADGAFRSRGRRATGTLRVFAIFNDQNQQDADGSIRCASASFGWTARRR